MKDVFIKHAHDDKYWIIVESTNEAGMAHPITLDEIKLIRDACNTFLESEE